MSGRISTLRSKRHTRMSTALRARFEQFAAQKKRLRVVAHLEIAARLAQEGASIRGDEYGGERARRAQAEDRDRVHERDFRAHPLWQQPVGAIHGSST